MELHYTSPINAELFCNKMLETVTLQHILTHIELYIDTLPQLNDEFLWCNNVISYISYKSDTLYYNDIMDSILELIGRTPKEILKSLNYKDFTIITSNPVLSLKYSNRQEIS